MKKLVIIPGLTHHGNEEGYIQIAKAAKKKGYTVEVLKLKWKRRVMSDYIAQCEAKSTFDANTTIVGFSFGAYIALVLSAKYQCQHVILASLSPYFSEDLHKIPKRWRQILGKHRMDDFIQFSFRDIVAKVSGKTSLFIGGDEHEYVWDRMREAERCLNTKLQVVQGVPHDISDKRYSAAIISIL